LVKITTNDAAKKAHREKFMNGNRAENDNNPARVMHRIPRHGRANFSWKIEHYPRRLSVLLRAEAANVQELRPLRVLTIKLEPETEEMVG
jgi:hypothetical protein